MAHALRESVSGAIREELYVLRLAVSLGQGYVMLLCSIQPVFRVSFRYQLAMELTQAWCPVATGKQHWRV